MTYVLICPQCGRKYDVDVTGLYQSHHCGIVRSPEQIAFMWGVYRSVQ